jgi:hypothetical protein
VQKERRRRGAKKRRKDIVQEVSRVFEEER